MAFNGSGTFARLYNWVNDAAANIKIRSDKMDAEMDGFATGLSTCITKDGQTTITANLPMATYKHTGVGNATARTHYAAAGQAIDGVLNWADGGGTADAITATNTIPITALIDGQLCFVRATAANATTTPTFAPDGLTARTIVKNGGAALVAGDIAGDGHELVLRYNLSGTKWELLNPANTLLTASSTFSGNNTFSGTTTLTGAVAVAGTASAQASISLAEDTDNGTNKVIIQPPATLAADYTLTLPADDGTSGQGLSTDGSGVLSWVGFALTTALGKQIVQRQIATTAAAATGTTQVPDDDTIPQNTEGFEVVTVSITPTNSANKLVISGTIHAAAAAGERCLYALFQDTTANALAAWGTGTMSANMVGSYDFVYEMVAGTTSATTFKIRIGPVSAATTITINGHGGVRKLGGVLITNIKAEEIQV